MLYKTLVMLLRGFVKARQFCFIGKNVKLGKNTRISPNVFLESNIVIGDNSFVGYGCVIRPNTLIGHSCSFGHLTVIEGETIIGNNVSFHAQCHITRGTIVEDHVFVAPFYLGTNTKQMDHGRGICPPIKGPVLKRGARIGANVVLVPGITIGENSVVGAGSLVTKNVPSGEVWYGNPAKKHSNVPEDEYL